MSAIAGRVLIIPKGAYNANVTYNLLDAVFFNGSTYIAKDTTTGNPPSDTEHWQILAQGAQDAAAAVFFGTCITAGSSQNKEVSVEVADNFALKRGAIVGVKFSNTNTFVASAANHVTLNVNSSGVYSIYFGNSADPEGVNPVAFGEAGYTNYYQFDGTYWTYVGRSGVQTAKQTSYDGTSSGLSSDNVNDAIDEVLDYAEDISTVISANGAKNLCYNNVLSKSENGLTFTANVDGTVTVSGTASARTLYAVSYGANALMTDGAIKLSGCPTGGGASTYSLCATMGYKATGTYHRDVLDYGSGADIDLGTADYVQTVWIIIESGTAITTPITFKPMITLVNQPNSDYAHYVPYAKTNKELTEDGKITELTSLTDYKGSTIDNIYGYAVKKGKMVSISFWWHGSVNNTQPIITLPSEFRPTKNIYCGGEQVRTNDTASTPAFYVILPAGGIYQSITATPCLEGSLSFTYAI